MFKYKNGGRTGIRTQGGSPLGGFQDRCLKPLDHSSASCILYKMPCKSTFVKFYLQEKGKNLSLIGLMICKNSNLVAYYIDYCFVTEKKGSLLC